MTKLTPSERAMLGRIDAYIVHSRHDGRELTRPTREAFWSKFEFEVDPEGTLDPVERARRADMARKAHFARLAYLSAKARRRQADRRGDTVDDSTLAITRFPGELDRGGVSRPRDG